MMAHDHSYAQPQDKTAPPSISVAPPVQTASPSTDQPCSTQDQSQETDEVDKSIEVTDEELDTYGYSQKEKDSDYRTESSETESEVEEDDDQEDNDNRNIYDDGTYPHDLKQDKYIVNDSNLMELMKFCQKCGSPINECIKSVKGPTVCFNIECLSGCSYTWKSQPGSSSLLLASSILATGNTFSKISSFAKTLNLKFIGPSTFREHQRDTVIPVIQQAWEKERVSVVEDMKQKDNLILAGDARCDSPGYNAKYGSYTLMDTTPTSEHSSKKKIVSLEVVQVSEVKNSNHMEPEGLRRCLAQIIRMG